MCVCSVSACQSRCACVSLSASESRCASVSACRSRCVCFCCLLVSPAVCVVCWLRARHHVRVLCLVVHHDVIFFWWQGERNQCVSPRDPPRTQMSTT